MSKWVIHQEHVWGPWAWQTGEQGSWCDEPYTAWTRERLIAKIRRLEARESRGRERAIRTRQELEL